ncbi:hypothetical protein [Planococcus lenghuensis]|uniref:DUF3221 domain-containing protein n=1 Tax=Planococcus lenghuensis TaxID=2213202 RepID=A0A1Q2KYW7_9BACL|nr:hypothetical protein [Planococcus lenghuensis]AQQ53304.1 hypothetical protein B0X71_09585 [Planococcus lenghuensis]
MLKKIVPLLVLCVILSACTADGNTAPSSMLSPVEGKYVVLVLFEEDTPQQQVNEVTDTVVGTAQETGVLQEAVISMRPDEYGIETEEYPFIMITDSREIVLKTTDAGEAAAFFRKAP